MPTGPSRRTSDSSTSAKGVSPRLSETQQGWQTRQGLSEREVNQLKAGTRFRLSGIPSHVQCSAFLSLYQNHVAPWLDRVGAADLHPPTSLLTQSRLYSSSGSCMHTEHVLSNPKSMNLDSTTQSAVPILLRRVALRRHFVTPFCSTGYTGSLPQGSWKGYACCNSRHMEGLLSSRLWVLLREDVKARAATWPCHFMSLGTKATTL